MSDIQASAAPAAAAPLYSDRAVARNPNFGEISGAGRRRTRRAPCTTAARPARPCPKTAP